VRGGKSSGFLTETGGKTRSASGEMVRFFDRDWRKNVKCVGGNGQVF
jgi:hypothetical protein